MTKTVGQFEKEVFEAIRAKKYIELPPIIHKRGIATIKLRFRIKGLRNSFVQFYYNEDNGKTSTAMVVEASRVYGHDYTPQQGWHRHLPPKGEHDYTPDGKRPITVKRFIEEVDGIIKSYDPVSSKGGIRKCYPPNSSLTRTQT